MSAEEKILNVEEARDEYLAMEQDILKGLLAAAEEQKTEIVTIEIARKGKVYFRFRIRGLTEKEYNECREKATKYVTNRRLGGLRLPQDTDAAMFRSYLIYKATIEEDREKIWDNKEAWERLGVLSGPELIDKVLMAGEKAMVIDKIDQLSGYEEELEEVAKNS